ncbi:MAG: hypothetical protein AAF598_04960, partial [Bacteroidota bacterium]
SMIWLIVAFIIDAVDGTFARLFKVTEVLPDFNGKTMDYLIDFCTYALIPCLFMYQAKGENGAFILPESEPVRLALISLALLVSVIYYGKEGMVSDDYAFVGFPVLWNLVAFYVFFVWDFSPEINGGIILLAAIMHFVPIKYPYPSRRTKYFWPNIIASVYFGGMSLVLLAIYPTTHPVLFWSANLMFIYFGLMSWLQTFKK